MRRMRLAVRGDGGECEGPAGEGGQGHHQARQAEGGGHNDTYSTSLICGAFQD